MSELIDEFGRVTNDRTIACIENVKAIIAYRLYCLVDAGIEPVEIKAIAQTFCEAITEITDDAITDRLDQLARKKAEELNDNC
jgi:hypothetical protein